MPTKIEWCDETWNPVTGCTPISAGCQNCYAKRMANRLRGRFGYPKDDPFKPATHHGYDVLNRPLSWRKPRRIFTCSMGDLFHDKVKLYDQLDIWKIVEECRQHTFLMLTKRPDRMKWFFDKMKKWGIIHNLWLGVTAENQKRYEERWIIASKIPAMVKFVSLEPALEYIDIDIFAPWPDWVIWGPETGPGKRPFKNEWAESVFKQCQEKNIPFFDKRKNYLAREFPKEK